MSLYNYNEPKIAILSCASLAQEIRSVAEEYPYPYVLKVINATCHRDPGHLVSIVDSYISSLLAEGMKIFITYGNCCSFVNLDSNNIHQVDAFNCAAILLGGNKEYLKYADNAYFLTPYLSRNWKFYFLGKSKDFIPDEKTLIRFKKWFNTIDIVVKISINTNFHKDEKFLAGEFAQLIDKPINYVDGSINFLRREYRNFLSSFSHK